MFCIYCGKQLSEGEVCSCQASQPESAGISQPVSETSAKEAFQPVTPTQPETPHNEPIYTPPVYVQPTYAQPTYAQPAYTQPAYTQPAYTQPVYPQQTTPVENSKPVEHFKPDGYTEAIASVIKPPVTVFIALLLTFGFSIKLVGSMEFDPFLLLSMIAAWVINAQTRTYNYRPKANGYKLLATVELFYIIIQSIATLGLLLMLSVFIIDGSLNVIATKLYRFFNGNISGYSVTLTPLAIVSLCLIVVAFCGLVLYYHISLRNNFLYIRKRLSQKPVREHFTAFPNILLILHGATQIIFAVIIITSKTIIMHYINKYLDGNQELALSILTIGISFGIPVGLFLLGIAKILAGSVLCRLSCKFKKVTEQ